jgi:thioredoxin 1
MAAPIAVGEDTFDEEVVQSQQPVLVDFWAPWCAPCRMVAPIVEELAEEMEGKMKVAKVNVDDNIGIAERYGIRSIPTLLLFKDGQVAVSIIGYRPKKELEDLIAKALLK